MSAILSSIFHTNLYDYTGSHAIESWTKKEKDFSFKSLITITILHATWNLIRARLFKQ